MRFVSFVLALLFLLFTSTTYAQNKKDSPQTEPDYSILVNDHSQDDEIYVFIYVPAEKFVYRNENTKAFKGIEVGYIFGGKKAYIAITRTNSLIFFTNDEDPKITTVIMDENGNLRVRLPKGKTFEILYR